MKNKTILLSLLLLVFTISSSYAQQGPQQPPKPPSIKERVEHSMKILNKKITVSDAQNTQIKPVLNSFITDLDKLMVKGQQPDITKVQALEKVRDTKMKSILSEKQYQIYRGNLMDIFPKPPKEGQRPPKRK